MTPEVLQHGIVYERIRDLRLFGTRLFTAPKRVLPDFLVIGAARSGTTSLYSYLCDHPNVCPAFTKEIHFFDRRYHRGLNWYRTHFPLISEGDAILAETGQRMVTGEATPTYLFDSQSPARVARELPAVKLIVLLRNPVERAFSTHSLLVKQNRETLSFEAALQREDDLIQQGRRPSHLAHYYKTRGIYVDQIRRWLEHFSRESMLILKSEDLFRDTRTAFDRILAFLSLDTIPVTSFQVHNAATKSTIDTQTRRGLIDFFRPYNEQLSDLLCADFQWE